MICTRDTEYIIEEHFDNEITKQEDELFYDKLNNEGKNVKLIEGIINTLSNLRKSILSEINDLEQY